ncbi:MAG TPA: hypothetical protein VK139_03780, partial [Microbacteriaceae bacterium]|nr:hypothetical protein [Microbacteriaceae bacterium]
MSWLSGGVLFVVGALVWGAYLLPTLIRRRQQHASGLEAEQFEHALVALAETGELPEQPLSAREHIRLARAQDRAERKIERENLRALSSAERERKQSERTARLEEKRSVAHRRAELIRLRTFTAWTLLVAVLCAVGGVVAVFFGVTWIVSGVGLVVAIGAVFALRVIARALTSLRQTAVAQAPVSVSFRDVPLGQQAATIPSRTWQPTALPAPLHLAPGSAAAST